MPSRNLSEIFDRFAARASAWTGKPLVFSLAVAFLLIWAATGPIFSFSENWQLVVNTGTTIITFLMVFIIQNSQNREARANQIKLDELIRALHGAKNDMIGLEDLTTGELEELHTRFESIAATARQNKAQLIAEKHRRSPRRKSSRAQVRATSP